MFVRFLVEKLVFLRPVSTSVTFNFAPVLRLGASLRWIKLRTANLSRSS